MIYQMFTFSVTFRFQGHVYVLEIWRWNSRKFDVKYRYAMEK